MTNIGKLKRTPADSNAAHVVLTFHPFTTNTQATVTLVDGMPPNAQRMRVWGGYLDITRGDLAGVSAGEMTRLLCAALIATLPTNPEPELAEPSDSAPA